MTTEERQQEKYKQWISELGFRAMDAEKLEEYIIEKSVIQRELTVKERQFLHIVNGTSHKFTENTTCYYCDDKVTEGMMCEDCRAERLGDCDGCGKRIISKAYATDGISRDTKLPLNLCRVCMREHGRCSNMEGHRQCEHVVKMKDCLCDTCHNAYCTEHTQHEHMGYNGHQREYHHRVYDDTARPTKYIKDTRLVGLELEAVGGNYEKLHSDLREPIGISHDGSLKGSNPVEIQTPPANGVALEEFISNACMSLANAGFVSNDSCGMHIHVDCSDVQSKPAKIRQIVNTYYAIEPIIYAMLPASRTDNAYAQPLSNWISGIGLRTIAEVGRITMHRLEEEWYKTDSTRGIARCKDRKYDSSRYHGLNLHPLFQEGHIEMRYHHGTTNAMAVTNWIKFHLHIMNWAIKKYNETDIESIYNERHSTQKINKMLKCLRLPTELRRYVRRSIRRATRINKINKR